MSFFCSLAEQGRHDTDRTIGATETVIEEEQAHKPLWKIRAVVSSASLSYHMFSHTNTRKVSGFFFVGLFVVQDLDAKDG
jgi:hypothetical protein